MKLRNSHSKAASSGFTLIELLVAMVITVVIVTILISITGVAMDAWTRSSSEVRAARQAKVFLDTMAKDFESLVTRRGNNFEWLHAEIDAAANLPKVTRNQAGQSQAAALTFMTAATDRYLGQPGGPKDRGGDVSCVSYRLRYQDPIKGGTPKDTSTFVLYRLLVDPNETFATLLGKEDLKTAFQPIVARSTERQNFTSENVHQFTITFLVEIMREVPAGSGTMAPRTVRVTLSSDAPGSKITVTGSGLQTNVSMTGVTPGQLAAGHLRAVEISISVLSDAAIVRRNAGDGLFDVLFEMVVIVGEQAELPVVGDVAGHPRLRVGFVAAHDQPADLLFEIGPSVGVADRGGVGGQARDFLGYDVLMLDRLQGDGDPGHCAHLPRPLAGAVDDLVALDRALIRHDPGDPVGVHREARHADAFVKPGPVHPRALGEALGDVRGTGLAVGRQPRRADQVGCVHQGPHRLCLGGPDQVHVHAEGPRGGDQPFEFGPAVGGGGEPQATGHFPAGAEAGFHVQPFVQIDGVFQDFGDRRR